MAEPFETHKLISEAAPKEVNTADELID